MEKKIILGTITKKEQLKNSTVGGPCVRVWITTEGGNEVVAKTASNSSAGYCLSCSMSYLQNKVLKLEAHETKAGNIIITRILSGYYGA